MCNYAFSTIMLQISFVSHFYCIIYAILTQIAITPYIQLYIIIICKYRGAYVYIIILYALSINLYCINSILHVLLVATRKLYNMSLLVRVNRKFSFIAIDLICYLFINIIVIMVNLRNSSKFYNIIGSYFTLCSSYAMLNIHIVLQLIILNYYNFSLILYSIYCNLIILINIINSIL